MHVDLYSIYTSIDILYTYIYYIWLELECGKLLSLCPGRRHFNLRTGHWLEKKPDQIEQLLETKTTTETKQLD